jgi:hypothetical protein
MIKQFFYYFIIHLAWNYSILKMPFDKLYSQNNFKKTPIEIFKELTNNLIRVNISVGEPKQEISLNLTFESYITFLSGINVKGNFKKFNENYSNSYKKIDNKINEFYSEHFIKGVRSSDNFHLIFYKLGEKTINNFNFVLANELDNREETGQLGLCYGDIISGNKLSDFNFIAQLHKKNLISSYAFTIKYNDFEQGELIIGALPHEYDNNYKEKDFITIKTGNSHIVSWSLFFKEISYGNEILFRKIFIEFKLEFGFIQANSELKHKLIKEFFQYHSECHMIKDEKIYFYCDNNSGIIKFKNIIFSSEVGNYNFNLNYNDLFIKNDDKYFFLIVFPLNDDNKFWQLGKPFLKKFQFIFDQDKKLIGFYKKIYSGDFGIIFLFILSLILIVLLGIFILIFLKKNKRKKRNNEIDDGFDYELKKHNFFEIKNQSIIF